MRLGIHNRNFTLPGQPASLAKLLAETAVAAEEGGCVQFTVMDHWFQMESLGDPHQPMLESYSTLAFLAAHTSTMRLGTLVTGVTYRYPGFLAKTAATLDVLSEGRAMLGIGAGWYEREHRAFGVPFPALGERFELLEETLRIAKQMYSDDDGPFEGRHFTLAETACYPQPLQNPLPILVGGAGEKKTLRLVAKYASISHIIASPDGVERKLGVLREHCDTEGTDYDAIEKSSHITIDPVADPDGFLREAELLRAAGVDLVTIPPSDADPAGWVRAATEKVGARLAAI